MSRHKLTVGITMGDPAGIGPEVTLKALQDKKIQDLANFLLIGNSFVLEKTAQRSRIKLNIKEIKNADELAQSKSGEIALLNIGRMRKLVSGKCNSAYGLLALACIKQALGLIKAKTIDVLVTAPVNKHTIERACGRFAQRPGQAGDFFRGHTEYLAAYTKTKDFAMMLVGGRLRVVLATRHIALKEVAGSLTTQQIYRTLRITAQALRKYFGLAHPRIAVCGLNPHSGDDGLIGAEEARIIRPAVSKAKGLARIIGPLAADTIFHSSMLGKFDAVCAMYHDQGLIPLKMLAFERGVNITLGLPFVRTSPDHGTAYDIAGKNIANPGSMKEAIKLAVKIGSRMKKNTVFS